MDLKSTMRLIVDFLTDDKEEILPLTTPTTPLREVIIVPYNPHRPDFYSHHGALAPYLYDK